MKMITRLMIAMSSMALPLMMAAETTVLLQTFNNPTPAAGDNFGAAIAALGSDRVLVGAPQDDTTATNAGIVYLFHTNGTLLTTITNPPGLNGGFGTSIATLGSDRIAVVLAHHVCLFTTNGALVTIITNWFQPLGPSVVAIGNDKLLIGSPDAYPEPVPDWGGVEGAAFLYGTNGTLLMIFFNPDPEAVSAFGYTVAAFGSDRVLIGARNNLLNAVYLFHTNGTLLMTLTNPPPAVSGFDPSGFDPHPMAAVGTDRVFVGEPVYGTNTGIVRLFNTNGTLLLTITNPTPPTVAYDYFGAHIAVLGNDRVVIGHSGSPYVFSLNGTLLATINNPSPGVGSGFGSRLEAIGNDGMLISAPGDNGGVGAAYLFNIPSTPVLPSLAIKRTPTNTVVVSWPSTATDFVLQQNANGLSSVNWSNAPGIILDDGTNKSIVVSPATGNGYYRLLKQ